MHYYLMGVVLGFSLIICLGPQNLFLIQQSIRREYPWLVATVCFCCDIFLILISVIGTSHLIVQFPFFHWVLLLGGVLFLIYYGLKSIRAAFAVSTLHKPTEAWTVDKRLKIILITLSFSLLNPQAIIDTVIMIGGSANHLGVIGQYYFMLGTVTASFLWFYSLTFTATQFADILARPRVFQILQLSSGLLMLFCAFKLATWP